MSKELSRPRINHLIRPQIDQILENKEEYENSDPVRVGIESEFGVLNGSKPSSGEWREKPSKEIDWIDYELGAAMVETQTPPMELDSLEELERMLGMRTNKLAEEASKRGCSLLRYGANPFVKVSEIQITHDTEASERYEHLVNTFDKLREENLGELPEFGEREVIDPANAAIPAAICSTQTNIQSEGWEDAAKKFNYAAMTLPYAIALSGNSRIIEGKDTGLSDTRMALWEMNYNTAETPSKVGPVEGYLENEEEYFSRLDIYFEDEGEDADHLSDAIAEHWKDVRIKIESGEDDKQYPVVEVRPLSMQPSPAEEAAVHGFMLGRIAYSQEEKEELLPYEAVLGNREKAMFDGLDTEELVYWDEEQEVAIETANKVLEQEIGKARQGLDYLGVRDLGYMDILEERLENGTPSDHSVQHYNKLRDEICEEEALKQSLPVVNHPSWNSQNLRQTHYSGSE